MLSLDTIREDYRQMSLASDYKDLKELWQKLGECQELCDSTGLTDVKTLLDFARREVAAQIDRGEREGLWNFDSYALRCPSDTLTVEQVAALEGKSPEYIRLLVETGKRQTALGETEKNSSESS